MMMAALAGFMVACGSEKKAEEKTEAAVTPETVVVEDVTAEETTATPEATTVNLTEIKANEKEIIDIPAHQVKGAKKDNDAQLILPDSKLQKADEATNTLNLNADASIEIKTDNITIAEVVK